jgi:glucose-6-phosphate dehydrogenase assembly protein OpcA
MPAAASPNTAILGQEVPLPRIASALRELWADESAGMRASLMNFAIYSEDASSLERSTTLLSELMQEHSCRALLILNLPGQARPQARAWVTAHCQLSHGRKSVCCEQLSFVIEGGSTDQVRNTIFAHLDSDLPLVVWWQGEVTARLDERFLSVIDSLIIDSSQWSDPGKTLRRVLEARAARTSRFSLSDLAWMRSRCMRLALAAACQNPLVLADLARVNRVTLTHHPKHRLSACMIAAWIGTQLKCQLVEGNALRLARRGGADIDIVLKPGAGECPVQALELAGPDLSISIGRDAGSCFVRSTTVRGGQKQEVVQPAPSDKEADLIGEQLSRLGGTTRYFEIVPLLVALLARE